MVRADGDRSVAVPDRPRLDELIGRYLSTAVRPRREDSTVEMVVDGRAWMLRMRKLLGSVGREDAVYICGLQLQTDMDLTGRTSSQP